MQSDNALWFKLNKTKANMQTKEKIKAFHAMTQRCN